MFYSDGIIHTEMRIIVHSSNFTRIRNVTLWVLNQSRRDEHGSVLQEFFENVVEVNCVLAIVH